MRNPNILGYADISWYTKARKHLIPFIIWFCGLCKFRFYGEFWQSGYENMHINRDINMIVHVNPLSATETNYCTSFAIGQWSVSNSDSLLFSHRYSRRSPSQTRRGRRPCASCLWSERSRLCHSPPCPPGLTTSLPCTSPLPCCWRQSAGSTSAPQQHKHRGPATCRDTEPHPYPTQPYPSWGTLVHWREVLLKHPALIFLL